MSDRNFAPKFLGRALLCVASPVIGGLVARAYAIAMPKLSGGQPVSLSPGGEATFFILGALLAGATAVVVGTSRRFAPAIEKHCGIVGLGLGIGIGAVCGLFTIPGLCALFITLPHSVFDFLTQQP